MATNLASVKDYGPLSLSRRDAYRLQDGAPHRRHGGAFSRWRKRGRRHVFSPLTNSFCLAHRIGRHLFALVALSHLSEIVDGVLGSALSGSLAVLLGEKIGQDQTSGRARF